jgi:hypothetical protein
MPALSSFDALISMLIVPHHAALGRLHERGHHFVLQRLDTAPTTTISD